VQGRDVSGLTEYLKARSVLRFTALLGMPERTSDQKAVCLSVKRVICDKTEEISVQIFIPYERPFSQAKEKGW